MTINDLQYSVKRSKRRTLAIRCGFDGSLTVLAPFIASRSDIEKAIEGNLWWITKKSEERKKLFENKDTTPIDAAETVALMKKAKERLPERFDSWANVLDVSYNKLSVKLMLSRWGSCSSARNISVNCLLMLAPEYVIDYIIVHELAHIKHMDHSKDFYIFVDKHFHLRKKAQLWLKNDGVLIINRARSE